MWQLVTYPDESSLKASSVFVAGYFLDRYPSYHFTKMANFYDISMKFAKMAPGESCLKVRRGKGEREWCSRAAMKKLLWKDKQVEAWVDNVHIGKSPSTLSTRLEKCQKNSENVSKIVKMETECKVYFVLFFRFAVNGRGLTPKRKGKKRQSLVLVFTSSHETALSPNWIRT